MHGTTISRDLRERVVGAVESGVSRRKAAAVFGVGIATVIEWMRVWRNSGRLEAKPMGGDPDSRLKGGAARVPGGEPGGRRADLRAEGGAGVAAGADRGASGPDAGRDRRRACRARQACRLWHGVAVL